MPREASPPSVVSRSIVSTVARVKWVRRWWAWRKGKLILETEVVRSLWGNEGCAVAAEGWENLVGEWARKFGEGKAAEEQVYIAVGRIAALSADVAIVIASRLWQSESKKTISTAW